VSTETFIRSYNIPDVTLCDEIIKWFEDHPEKQGTGVVQSREGKPIVNKDYKDGTCISVNDINYAYTQPPLRSFLIWLWDCVNLYLEDFPELKNSCFAMREGFNIQRFLPPSQGFKVFHHERISYQVCPRLLVFMLYLNDVEDKGGTEFKYYNHVEKAQRGKLLIWPTDFTHTHRGVVSPTEKKYIITGWYGLIPAE